MPAVDPGSPTTNWSGYGSSPLLPAYVPPYVPPAYQPPPPGAALPAVGGSSSLPAVGGVPSAEQMAAFFANSPMYKQGMQTLTSGVNQNLDRAAQMHALSAMGGGGGGGGFTQTVPQSFYDQIALAKEKAGHDQALQQAAIPEIMAGRGMLSSGQTGFEQTESKYQYDTLLKDIELQKKAREEAVAQANAASAASAAASRASSGVAAQRAALEYKFYVEDMTAKLASGSADVLNSVGSYHQNLWFTPDGRYVGPTSDQLASMTAAGTGFTTGTARG